MNETTQPAVAGPVEPTVRPADPERDNGCQTATAVALLALGAALVALSRGGEASATRQRPRSRYDWVDHVSGLSLMDKLLGK